MGYSWFLKLALSCIDHFAWPLLALGYPLYASVQAIETDSHSETRDLISYWILLSLIYLFEYAFLGLLSRFQFWPYIKLMIIFWFVIPDFGQASYVYNNFIRSCISVKPQAVISELKNGRKLFAKKENFLLHAEGYIEENGTEALQKLIASKITTRCPDSEASNTIRASDKKEMQQTNGKRLLTEHKYIKDLEVIEKKEISACKQDIPVMPDLFLSQNVSSPRMEINGMRRKDAAGGELPQSSTHKEVQKEWTCAVSQVKTSCEKNLNMHPHWREHKAACEALNAKNQLVPQKLKNDQSKEDLKQKNVINQLPNEKKKNVQIFRVKEHAQTSREPEKSMLSDPVTRRNVGQESNSTRDPKGVHAPAKKTDQLSAKSKNGESIANNGLKGKVIINHEKVQGLQKNLGKPVMMKNSKLRCEACNVSCSSEVDMASHLKGRRHLIQIQMCSERVVGGYIY